MWREINDQIDGRLLEKINKIDKKPEEEWKLRKTEKDVQKEKEKTETKQNKMRLELKSMVLPWLSSTKIDLNLSEAMPLTLFSF